MGVSQSQTVLDLLPASGTAAPKRKQGSSNQAMFDVALKSASASVAQASGKDQLAKQDVAASRAEAKGKAVPQNGKELPEKAQRAQRDQAESLSETEQVKPESKSSAEDTSSAVNKLDDTRSDQTSADSDASTDPENKDSESEVASSNKDERESGLPAGAEVKDDTEDAVASTTDFADDIALASLSEKELSELLSELKSGELSGEEFLAKLERVLESEGVSLEDLKTLMVENDILSEEKFDQLLNNPEAFIAQLQQIMQPGSDLSAQLKDLGIQADVIARLSVAINNRLQQDSVPRFADILKAEANTTQQTGSLVSQLLQEQGSGKDADAGFDKDRLFEQLLAQKAPDKTSGFAGLVLKDGGAASGLLGSSGLGAAVGNAVSGAEGLQGLAQRSGLNAQAQNLPQLPVLRGLPGQPGATEALNERIMMMRSKGIQTAEIRLDPPDLGSLEVRVRVSGDSTTIQFHSPNPSVREALEAQVNRLREMMEGAGVNLGQVDVSDQSLSENSDGTFASSGGSSGGKGDADGESANSDEGAVAEGVTQSGLGLVDYFA